MTELRGLAASDDCEIVVVGHGVASIFFPEPIADDAYIRARRQFFALLADAQQKWTNRSLDRFSLSELR